MRRKKQKTKLNRKGGSVRRERTYDIARREGGEERRRKKNNEKKTNKQTKKKKGRAERTHTSEKSRRISFRFSFPYTRNRSQKQCCSIHFLLLPTCVRACVRACTYIHPSRCATLLHSNAVVTRMRENNIVLPLARLLLLLLLVHIIKLAARPLRDRDGVV